MDYNTQKAFDFLKEHNDLIKNREWSKLYQISLKQNIGIDIWHNCLSLILSSAAYKYTPDILLSSLEIIPTSFFLGQHALFKLDIPNNVRIIQDKAFLGCNDLQKLSIAGSVVLIGKQAFWGNSNLKEIKLEEGIQLLEEGAFESTGISEITIPKSVREIGSACFSQCKDLKKVIFLGTELSVPENDLLKIFKTKKPKVTICCHKNSQIETLANEKNFDITYLEK